MKVTAKPPVYDALQFTGENTDEILQELNGRGEATVNPDGQPNIIVGGQHTLHPGEWLVTAYTDTGGAMRPQQIFSIFSDDEFTKRFQPA